MNRLRNHIGMLCNLRFFKIVPTYVNCVFQYVQINNLSINLNMYGRLWHYYRSYASLVKSQHKQRNRNNVDDTTVV